MGTPCKPPCLFLTFESASLFHISSLIVPRCRPLSMPRKTGHSGGLSLSHCTQPPFHMVVGWRRIFRRRTPSQTAHTRRRMAFRESSPFSTLIGLSDCAILMQSGPKIPKFSMRFLARTFRILGTPFEVREIQIEEPPIFRSKKTLVIKC